MVDLVARVRQGRCAASHLINEVRKPAFVSRSRYRPFTLKSLIGRVVLLPVILVFVSGNWLSDGNREKSAGGFTYRVATLLVAVISSRQTGCDQTTEQMLLFV